ncbi:ROCK2 [Mytilus coruscus]|uniref:ROCK2 n=1 Tax=Mytilus coruscus TaxID=42192 RepID=A0A6J8C2S2_MYTCO|nr:ROCK2 [Mytilus coruscus]
MATNGNEILKNIKIDTDLSKIDTEYPSNSLPTRLNKRTGKAKKCQFEAIDINMYEESAHVLLEYKEVTTSPLYKKDFPILIEIMKLLDTCDNDETSMKTIENHELNEVVTHPTINDQVMTVSEKQTKTDTNNINDETSEVSQNLNPSKPNIDNNNNAADTPAQTEVNLSRLQQCFLDTICKLEISQEKDTTTILEAINGCRILLLQGQSQLDHKSTDKGTLSKELQSVQKTIKSLQEEKDSLKSQLQIEKGNVTLLKCQKDDIMHHTNGQIVNALIKQNFYGKHYTELEKVQLIEHNNMYYEGQANEELLQNDLYHLNDKGVSYLASNIKQAVHQILNIPLPPTRRPRSQSRNRRGRGRGRGDTK